MPGVNGVGGANVADLMKILENNQQQTMDLAKKMIKVANSSKVSQSEATGLGQALDLYG